MTIELSRKLAALLGIVTPVLETIRRWSTWRENPPALFDDYVVSAFLLYGAWRVGKDPVSGQRFLTAAWGVGLGMIFLSFFGQLNALRQGELDPAPVSSESVAVIKGVGFVIIILGLVSSLRKVEVKGN
ncbi:MAG TPA: hypothetical protein VFZ23_15115 [Pyrinomonadaceae bacterium]